MEEKVRVGYGIKELDNKQIWALTEGAKRSFQRNAILIWEKAIRDKLTKGKNKRSDFR